MSTADPLEEVESEGYFASVSDLMVGVLFVFLLMLAILALNFRDDSAKLDEAIARAEQAEREAEASRLEAEQQRRKNAVLQDHLKAAAAKLQQELAGREAARVALLQRLAAGLEARNIQARLDIRSGVLRLSDAVPFDNGESKLTDKARRTAIALGDTLAEVLPCFAVGGAEAKGCGPGDGSILEAVLVEGHTDQKPYVTMTAAESRARNDLLSAERALSVFAQMLQRQPSLEGLRNGAELPLFGIAGYGQRRPLPEATALSEAHLAQNRRIDLRFILSSRSSDEIRKLLDDIDALQKDDQP